MSDETHGPVAGFGYYRLGEIEDRPSDALVWVRVLEAALADSFEVGDLVLVHGADVHTFGPSFETVFSVNGVMAHRGKA